MNQNDFFEQATQITKAYGYDILADQVQQLKYENAKLKGEKEVLEIELKWEKVRVEMYKKFLNDTREIFTEDKDDLKDINI